MVNDKCLNNCKPDSFLTQTSFQLDWDTAKKWNEPLCATDIIFSLPQDWLHISSFSIVITPVKEIQSAPRRWFKECIRTKHAVSSEELHM